MKKKTKKQNLTTTLLQHASTYNVACLFINVKHLIFSH